MDVNEAIAVFDKSAERTKPNVQTEAWAILRRRIEFLTDLVEEQKCTIQALTMGCEHLGGTTPILRKLGELEHDAERIDWLEARGWPGQFQRTHGRPEHQRWFDSETAGSDYSPTLRAAIDAARQQEAARES